MKIWVVIADSAPPNRSAFKRLGATIENPFIYQNGWKIYVMTDLVHLLKAPRINLLTHNFEANGSEIQWKHIEEFYIQP